MLNDYKLYPFQVEGINFLKDRQFGMLCDAQGLGKSAQSILAACALKKEGVINKVLVIVPNSLKYSWETEIKKFTNESVTVINGPPKMRHAQWKTNSFFTIINYEMLLTTDCQQHVLPEVWDLVIADECTYLKNQSAKRTIIANQIIRPRRWCLSGTPLLNSPLDVWSIVRFLHPMYLNPNFFAFRHHYCIMQNLERRGKTIPIIVGYKNLDELAFSIKDIFLRRTKNEVLKDLPDKSYQKIEISLTKEQQLAYNEVILEMRAVAEKEESTLGLLMKARMLCDGLQVGEEYYSAKLEALSDMIDDGLEKCIIFSEWTTVTGKIAEMLTKKEKKFGMITGEVSSSDRQKVIEDMNAGKIDFVVCTSAGEFGLNMQAFSNIVLFDCPWSWGHISQRADRVHRIGQVAKVQIIFLLARNTIEQHVVDVILEKKEMFDKLFSSQAQIEKFILKEMS